MIAPNRIVRDSNWSLSRLAEAIGAPKPERGGSVRIAGVQEDSRRCGPHDLFVAVPGSKEDGLRFARDAVARGAAAVAAERDPGVDAPWLKVPEARVAAGLLADLVYGDPSQRLALVGVTGTNGKSTTVKLLAQILHGPVGTIGTLGVTYPGVEHETDNTTPGPTDLRRHLQGMVAAGCRACAMEVSSHALDQRRPDGLRFAAAVYTNLTGDHLDYHRSMEAYGAAKARLFRLLGEGAAAVLNARDPACRAVETRARRHFFEAGDVRVRPSGTAFDWHGRRVATALVGRHNAENAAAALECAVALGVPEAEAIARLREASGARGRLEAVQREPRLVLVDYAHTDDALEKALRAAREIASGRLVLVFGCGGDRDRTKRPRMGAVASRWADRVFVTNDNPRTEDPVAIAEEICAGFREGRPIVRLDRRQAIAEAIAGAAPGDCVLIAGKGHETCQIVGREKRPFDDAAEARAALAALDSSGPAAQDRGRRLGLGGATLPSGTAAAESLPRRRGRPDRSP